MSVRSSSTALLETQTSQDVGLHFFIQKCDIWYHPHSKRFSVNCVKFEVLVDKTKKNRVFWDVFLYCLVEICQRLGIIYSLNIWGRQNGRYYSHYILHSSTLKMYKIGHSTTLVSLCNIAQRQDVEDGTFRWFVFLIHSIFNCIFYVFCFGWKCECYRNLIGSIYNRYLPWWHLTVQELLVIYIYIYIYIYICICICVCVFIQAKCPALVESKLPVIIKRFYWSPPYFSNREKCATRTTRITQTWK